MVEADVRVALLARAGAARDQLRRALDELGASLVAEGDPAELDPADVIGKSPTLVIVSLEPAIESALDRFDDLMSLPNVEVMYDDAEVTRQLDGWDLNRWARHLGSQRAADPTAYSRCLSFLRTALRMVHGPRARNPGKKCPTHERRAAISGSVPSVAILPGGW